MSDKRIWLVAVLAIAVLWFLGSEKYSSLDTEQPAQPQSTMDAEQQAKTSHGVEHTSQDKTKSSKLSDDGGEDISIVVQPQNASSDKQTIDTTNATRLWGYVKRDSTVYEHLQGQESSGPYLIGDNIYFRIETSNGVEYSEITPQLAQELTEQSYKTYNRMLETLNETEQFGEWSAEREQQLRALLAEHLAGGNYQVQNIVCRERACLAELSLQDIEILSQLMDKFRADRSLCRCLPMEYLWQEQNRGIISVLFD